MKKIEKKTVWLLLCTCMFLAGCASSSENTNSIKIGITVYDQYDVFISELMDNLNKDILAEEKNGVEISSDVYNASRSQTQQNEQVEDMIANGVDVLLVNLVDRTSPTEIIEMAKNADIPVVFFNRELVEEDLDRWNRLYYVGANAYQSGEMQGDIAAADYSKGLLDKNGDGSVQYVMMEGETGHQDSIIRSEYSVDEMINFGVKLDKLGYAIGNWDRSQALSQMTQLITENGTKIEMVLANNDDMALGVIDAYKQSGIPQDQWPRIYGVDGTKAGLAAMKEGTLSGTVYNNKEKQAEYLCKLSVRLAQGSSLDGLGLKQGKFIRIAYEKITSDNLDDYLK